MRDLLNSSPGERLSVPSYRNDFRTRFWAIAQDDFWKLERRQTFAEPGDESWEAFAAGDWNAALRLIDKQRDTFDAEARRMTEAGIKSFRVRVVEFPISSYLQWELRLLRLMNQISDNIRIIGPDVVRSDETRHVLPEVVTLGDDVTYEVRYDVSGTLSGAIRHVDRELTGACRTIIRRLYEHGEDLEAFFNREVARLRPPQPARN
ncbi:MAG: hypothetical protein V7637_4396 [Mycobacteriales bacterium]|jgi:hypothetical protein